MPEANFTRALNLRFRALRVHRRCAPTYIKLGYRDFTPSLRLDHYFPWLFRPAVKLREEQMLAIAVGNVFLSDAVHNSFNAIHAGAGSWWDHVTAVALRDHSLTAFCSVFENSQDGEKLRAAGQEIFRQQERAITLEAACIAQETFKTPEEWRYSKAVYSQLCLYALEIAGQVHGFAETLWKAHERLTHAVTIYESLVQWKQQLDHPETNWIFCHLVPPQARRGDVTEIARVIYEEGAGGRAIDVALKELETSAHISNGFPEYQKVIRMFSNTLLHLRDDFILLAAGA